MNGLQQNFWEENLPFGKILGSLFDGIRLILKDFSILRFSHLYFIKTNLRERKDHLAILKRDLITHTRLTGTGLINAVSASKRLKIGLDSQLLV